MEAKITRVRSGRGGRRTSCQPPPWMHIYNKVRFLLNSVFYSS